mgnify:CR=1 FL=1
MMMTIFLILTMALAGIHAHNFTLQQETELFPVLESLRSTLGELDDTHYTVGTWVAAVVVPPFLVAAILGLTYWKYIKPSRS